jgi:hypothetical protein
MKATTQYIDTYLNIIDSPTEGWYSSDDPKTVIAWASGDLRSSLLEVSQRVVHATECVDTIRNSLVAHLEFLVDKKAATNKVLTVSSQILELDNALESLGAIHNILDFPEMGV